jgi:hypothetical protein
LTSFVNADIRSPSISPFQEALIGQIPPELRIFFGRGRPLNDPIMPLQRTRLKWLAFSKKWTPALLMSPRVFLVVNATGSDLVCDCK